MALKRNVAAAFAIAVLTSAVQAADEPPPVPATEGERAFWQGDYVSAELAFFETLIADASDATAHYYLGRIYQERGYAGRALLHYGAARTRYAEADYFIAAIYYDQRRYEESAAAYRSYLQSYPDDASAWYNLGVTLAAAGRDDEAVTAYELALASNPRYPAALHNLAVTYHGRGDYGRAVFYWRRLVEVDPSSAEGYFGLALAAYAQKDHRAAVAALDAASALRPLESRYFYYLGRVYCDMAEYDLAVQAFNRAYELGHEAGAIAHGLGLAYAGRRSYDLALPLLEIAAGLDGPGAGEAYVALGRIERERGRLGLAVADFYEAAYRLPDAAAAYNEIGEIYLSEDLPTWAAEAFERALATAPDDARVNYNLAVAYDRSAPRRAAAQWRRYLASAEGIGAEAERAAEARNRIVELERLYGAGEKR